MVKRGMRLWRIPLWRLGNQPAGQGVLEAPLNPERPVSAPTAIPPRYVSQRALVLGILSRWAESLRKAPAA